jgi:hypothetical protein
MPSLVSKFFAPLRRRRSTAEPSFALGQEPEHQPKRHKGRRWFCKDCHVRVSSGAKRCMACHLAFKNANAVGCVETARLRNLTQRRHINAVARRSHRRNREARNARARAYNATRKDGVNAARRAAYAANPEPVRAAVRASYARHRQAAA